MCVDRTFFPQTHDDDGFSFKEGKPNIRVWEVGFEKKVGRHQHSTVRQSRPITLCAQGYLG